jgi:hypothetical protein
LNYLTRSYAQATQGYPISQSYDQDSGAFIFRYYCLTQVNGTTDIYLNEGMHYPNGYKISSSHEFGSTKVRKVIDETHKNMIKIKFESRVEGDELNDVVDLIVTPNLAKNSGFFKDGAIRLYYSIKGQSTN